MPVPDTPWVFKLEAVRRVKGGQAVPVTAHVLGVPVQTPGGRAVHPRPFHFLDFPPFAEAVLNPNNY